MTSAKVFNVKNLLALVGISLIAWGGWQLLDWYSTTQVAPKLPDPTHVVTETSTRPSETAPDVKKLSAPADMPMLIAIPSINVTGPVQSVGLTKDRAVVAPNNVYYAGWYNLSVKPGEDGNSIVDGHVQGRYQPGIFKNISKLKAQDEIRITYGDNHVVVFTVVSNETVPIEQATTDLFTQVHGVKKQLTLITCGGSFNNKTESYDKRTVVVARFSNIIAP